MRRRKLEEGSLILYPPLVREGLAEKRQLNFQRAREVKKVPGGVGLSSLSSSYKGKGGLTKLDVQEKRVRRLTTSKTGKGNRVGLERGKLRERTRSGCPVLQREMVERHSSKKKVISRRASLQKRLQQLRGRNAEHLPESLRKMLRKLEGESLTANWLGGQERKKKRNGGMVFSLRKRSTLPTEKNRQRPERCTSPRGRRRKGLPRKEGEVLRVELPTRGKEGRDLRGAFGHPLRSGEGEINKGLQGVRLPHKSSLKGGKPTLGTL